VLYGHFARANPHWKALDGKTPAVAVFRGPHGYISPGWYATKQENGKVVPTWNYVIVHARGIPHLLDPGDPTRGAIDLLTDTMEQPRAEPWKTDDAPERYMEVMMRGIVAFRMVVSDLTAKAKLSQNKTEADVTGAASRKPDARGDAAIGAISDCFRWHPLPPAQTKGPSRRCLALSPGVPLHGVAASSPLPTARFQAGSSHPAAARRGSRACRSRDSA